MFQIRLFISHSSADRELAASVVRLARQALSLPAAKIRCTSVEGYMLGGGTVTDDTLRTEAIESDAFVALLTSDSIESQYVLFEVGARWGANRRIVPLVAKGLESKELRAPLVGHALSRCPA